jgi:hypothetical protein
MRGKKSYNIRNIEAHINNFQQPFPESFVSINTYQPSNFLLNKKMIFQNINNNNNILTTQEQYHNEYLNAKYGVSRYASNLVSGKMFKKI